MIRALKIALIVLGVRNILLGLAFIVIPQLFANIWDSNIWGFGEIADYVPYIMGILGISLIAPSVWLIAAARDPLSHITWVKFGILWMILAVVVQLYSVIQGGVDFSQVRIGIISDAVFAAAFLVFYPWRAARSNE